MPKAQSTGKHNKNTGGTQTTARLDRFPRGRKAPRSQNDARPPSKAKAVVKQWGTPKHPETKGKMPRGDGPEPPAPRGRKAPRSTYDANTTQAPSKAKSDVKVMAPCQNLGTMPPAKLQADPKDDRRKIGTPNVNVGVPMRPRSHLKTEAR